MIGIYGIFRKSDDKCMYVGESINVEQRIKEHLFYHKTHINILFDNPDDFYGKIIEQHEVNDREYRLKREAYWINELNAEWNKCRDRHIIFSESHNKKISEGNKGKHPSEETKKKISAAMSGKPAWNKKHLWINNGTKSTLVKQEDLQSYLDNGYVLGRIKPLR